jgi:hypothetical protein
MDTVAKFAAEASLFREWAARGTDTGADAARNALVHITRLYLAALDLPPASSNELENDRDVDAKRVSPQERLAVRDAAGRIPLGYYSEVFNPLDPLPTEDPVVGAIYDDIEDIYSDVVYGLRSYEAGHQALAVWEWVFHFQIHWGKHATGAIRALHCWLAENAPEHLST